MLLLVDNTFGHSNTFERNDSYFVFFLPNVTFWKQQMDMGIIVAWKKAK